MRLVLFSLLLCAEPLLAQVPANQAGQVAIVSVDLTPDSPVSSQELQAVADEITKHTYFPRHLGEMVERARYTLQCDGYFKADVSLADTRAVTPDQTAIAITLAIREGYQYRLSEITFTGNKAVLTSELRNQFTIANGDVFDTEKIRRDLEGIRRVYVSRGYINFVPVPNTPTPTMQQILCR